MIGAPDLEEEVRGAILNGKSIFPHSKNEFPGRNKDY